jgi:hypothetical protein
MTDFQAADFLNSLTEVVALDHVPAKSSPPDTDGLAGASTDSAHPIDVWLRSQDWSLWSFGGGRYSGPECDTSESFEADPGEPCPTCNGQAWSIDILGGRHCQQCEPQRLDRSRQLAERAERLRKRAP